MEDKDLKRFNELSAQEKTIKKELDALKKSIKAKGSFNTDYFKVTVTDIHRLDSEKVLQYAKDNNIMDVMTKPVLNTDTSRTILESKFNVVEIHDKFESLHSKRVEVKEIHEYNEEEFNKEMAVLDKNMAEVDELLDYVNQDIEDLN